MECSGASGLHALRAFEIGRWSGSTAQDPDLTPSQREQRRHRLAAGVMPEGYAPLSKVARVCGILGDEMEALDHLWARMVDASTMSQLARVVELLLQLPQQAPARLRCHVLRSCLEQR